MRYKSCQSFSKAVQKSLNTVEQVKVATRWFAHKVAKDSFYNQAAQQPKFGFLDEDDAWQKVPKDRLQNPYKEQYIRSDFSQNEQKYEQEDDAVEGGQKQNSNYWQSSDTNASRATQQQSMYKRKFDYYQDERRDGQAFNDDEGSPLIASTMLPIERQEWKDLSYMEKYYHIKNIREVSDIQDILDKGVQYLSLGHMVLIFTRIPKCFKDRKRAVPKQSQSTVMAIGELLLGKIDELNKAQSISILWSLGQLNMSQLYSLGNQIQDKIALLIDAKELSISDLKTCYLSLAYMKLEVRKTLVRKLDYQFIGNLKKNEVQGSTVAVVCWVHAEINEHNEAFTNQVNRYIYHHWEDLSGIDIAQLFQFYQKMKLTWQLQQFDLLSKRLLQQLGVLDSYQLPNIVWACYQLGYRNPDLLQGLCGMIRLKCHNFPDWVIPNLFQALDGLNYFDEQTYDALSESAQTILQQKQTDEFRVQCYAKFATGPTNQRYFNKTLLDHIFQSTYRNVLQGRLNFVSIAQILYAYSTFDYLPKIQSKFEYDVINQEGLGQNVHNQDTQNLVQDNVLSQQRKSKQNESTSTLAQNSKAQIYTENQKSLYDLQSSDQIQSNEDLQAPSQHQYNLQDLLSENLSQDNIDTQVITKAIKIALCQALNQQTIIDLEGFSKAVFSLAYFNLVGPSIVKQVNQIMQRQYVTANILFEANKDFLLRLYISQKLVNINLESLNQDASAGQLMDQKLLDRAYERLIIDSNNKFYLQNNKQDVQKLDFKLHLEDLNLDTVGLTTIFNIQKKFVQHDSNDVSQIQTSGVDEQKNDYMDTQELNQRQLYDFRQQQVGRVKKYILQELQNNTDLSNLQFEMNVQDNATGIGLDFLVQNNSQGLSVPQNEKFKSFAIIFTKDTDYAINDESKLLGEKKAIVKLLQHERHYTILVDENICFQKQYLQEFLRKINTFLTNYQKQHKQGTDQQK